MGSLVPLIGLAAALALACTPGVSTPNAKTPTSVTPSAPPAPVRPRLEPPEVLSPEETAELDQSCRIDGFDFAYGYVKPRSQADAQGPAILCGMGPGTPCDAATSHDTCESATTHLFCHFRRLTAEDCRQQCTLVGDVDRITYEGGRCSDLDGKAQCVCCDGPKCIAYRSPLE